jgi:hypothetical protein
MDRMSDHRQLAHELVDRLPEAQLTGLVHFLETIVDPVAVALESAPLEDEEISDEEERAVAEAREWLKHNKPIPHDEVLAEFGLTTADFECMGQTPLPASEKSSALSAPSGRGSANS